MQMYIFTKIIGKNGIQIENCYFTCQVTLLTVANSVCAYIIAAKRYLERLQHRRTGN